MSKSGDDKAAISLHFFAAKRSLIFAVTLLLVLGITTLPSHVATAASSTQTATNPSVTTTMSPKDNALTGGIVSSVESSSGNVTVLASGQSFAEPIYVYNGYVYWYNFGNGKLNRVSEQGGKVDTLFTVGSSLEDLYGLVVQGNYVYWTLSEGGCCGYVERTEISTRDTTTLYSSGEFAVFGITVDKSSVFFVMDDSIVKMSLTGQNPTIIAYAPSHYVWQLTYSSGYVYWYDLCTGQIGKVTPSGGDLTLLSPALADCVTEVFTGIRPFDVVGTKIYWTFNFFDSNIAAYNNSVDTVSTSGRGFQMLNSTSSDIYGGVSYYNGNVIFVDHRSHSLDAIPPTGGTPTEIVSGYKFIDCSVLNTQIYASAETDILRINA